MDIWQGIAVGLALTAAAIQVTRRRVDAVMIGLLGLLLYHHPILLDWVRAAAGSVDTVATGAMQSIAIMFLVLVIAGLIVVLIPTSRHVPIGGIKDARVAAYVAVGIAMAGWAAFAAAVGPETLWFSTKRELMHVSESVGASRYHIIAYAFSSAGLVLAFVSRSRLATAAALVPIGIDVSMASNRTAMVLASVACLIMWSNARPFKRPILLSAHAIGIFVATLLAIFIIGEAIPKSGRILANLRSGDVRAIAEVAESPQLSEPHTVSLLLHATVENQLSMPDWNLANSLVNQIVPGGAMHIVNHNTVVQESLFPEISYGMSSSIIGEFWAMGGNLGVALAAAAWGAVLIALSVSLRHCRCASLQAIIAILVAILGFYIFRNDFGYTIQLCKRYVAAIAVSWALAHLLRRICLQAMPRSVSPCKELGLRD